jgi:hypothetical protein
MKITIKGTILKRTKKEFTKKTDNSKGEEITLNIGVEDKLTLPVKTIKPEFIEKIKKDFPVGSEIELECWLNSNEWKEVFYLQLNIAKIFDKVEVAAVVEEEDNTTYTDDLPF